MYDWVLEADRSKLEGELYEVSVGAAFETIPDLPGGAGKAAVTRMACSGAARSYTYLRPWARSGPGVWEPGATRGPYAAGTPRGRSCSLGCLVPGEEPKSAAEPMPPASSSTVDWNERVTWLQRWARWFGYRKIVLEMEFLPKSKLAAVSDNF